MTNPVEEASGGFGITLRDSLRIFAPGMGYFRAAPLDTADRAALVGMSEKQPENAGSDNPFTDRARRFLYETASKYTPFAVRWPESPRDRALVEGLLRTPRVVRQPTATALNLALDCDLEKYLPAEPPKYSPGMAVVTLAADEYFPGELVFVPGGALGWDCAAHPDTGRVGASLPGHRPDDNEVRLATRDELLGALHGMSDDRAERLARLLVVGVLTKKNQSIDDPFDL